MSDRITATNDDSPIVYLMRGLPSCGKSHSARKLAGETGIVCETDEFFHTQVGDDPDKFDYDAARREEARRWNYARFVAAVGLRRHPIVVDRGNGLNVETKQYASYAVQHSYRVQLAEPDSEWWQEIRVLLKYKSVTADILDDWAERLASRNRETHRTPVATIRRWMNKWRHDVTVDAILHCQSTKQRQPA